MIHFHIITLFPETIKPYLSSSVLGRAQDKGLFSVSFYNPIDFIKDNKRVDDIPYGGGPGMVLRAEPYLQAIQKAVARKKNVDFYFFSPSGKLFNSSLAQRIAANHDKTKHIVLLSARYEGLDNRVVEVVGAKPISIGPYVLSGGELPSAVFVDAVARFIPGVLGDQNSIEQNRVASSKVYTRPATIKFKNKKLTVPKVLLSGDHKKITQWRKEN